MKKRSNDTIISTPTAATPTATKRARLTESPDADMVMESADKATADLAIYAPEALGDNKCCYCDGPDDHGLCPDPLAWITKPLQSSCTPDDPHFPADKVVAFYAEVKTRLLTALPNFSVDIVGIVHSYTVVPERRRSDISLATSRARYYIFRMFHGSSYTPFWTARRRPDGAHTLIVQFPRTLPPPLLGVYDPKRNELPLALRGTHFEIEILIQVVSNGAGDPNDGVFFQCSKWTRLLTCPVDAVCQEAHVDLHSMKQYFLARQFNEQDTLIRAMDDPSFIRGVLIRLHDGRGGSREISLDSIGQAVTDGQ